MQTNRGLIIALVLVLGILVLVGWGATRVISTVQNAAESNLAPARQLADSISTEVANVLHPTPTIIPDPVTIIHEVRSLARLETIQYSVEKIIVAESGQGPFGFLFGDRLLLVAHGTAIAGVDMEQLGAEDLVVEDGILYVTLPGAEVFVATLDNDQSYIYDREKGALTKGDTGLETVARQAAEQQILAAALADGILDQAQINAENFLYRLFLDLGFQDVIFVDPDAN